VDITKSGLEFRQRQDLFLSSIRGTVNNFVEWPHSGAVMHCSEYIEPRDGAVSVLLSSQKKQLRVCGVFRKNTIAMKGSFLRAAKSRMSQFEQREKSISTKN
jgi:hypothetical protein